MFPRGEDSHVPKRTAARQKRDTQTALVCGEAFQRLATQFIPRIPGIKEGHSRIASSELGDLAACATNLAFAIELYLKALLTLLGLPVPLNHDPRALYDGIPEPVRNLIEQTYDAFWPDQLGEWSHVSVSLARGLGEPSLPTWDDRARSSASLPGLLERSRDLFQTWRYLFEFRQPEDRPHELRHFEYGHLWCAAEAIRAEVTVRLSEARPTPASNETLLSGVPSPEPEPLLTTEGRSGVSALVSETQRLQLETDRLRRETAHMQRETRRLRLEAERMRRSRPGRGSASA